MQLVCSSERVQRGGGARARAELPEGLQLQPHQHPGRRVEESTDKGRVNVGILSGIRIRTCIKKSFGSAII